MRVGKISIAGMLDEYIKYGRRTVARIAPGVDQGTATEFAQLITAIPAMVEALQEASRALMADRQSEKGVGLATDAWEKIDAALKKAGVRRSE